MKRLTKKDDRGYYLTGDGIYSDWGVPEKFRGEDIDGIATIENILGDDYELDDLKTAMWCKETVGMAFSEDTAPKEDEHEVVDAEPVVHCSDCIYLMFSDCYGECKRGYLGGIVKPDDYCSRGIRKEDNT